ncbi:MAG: arginine--tRNA ligase [Planctomycetes bacterium]|nr:arginine--tRNA ligase [Planctomycetota bacterium]
MASLFMQAFVDSICAAIAAASGRPAAEIRLESPKNPNQGDLAFPCFALAKAQRAAPPAIAAALAPRVAAALSGITCTPTGPYLNFRIERAALAREILGEIESRADAFGTSRAGEGKTIVVDYGSPNIAKPMHVGHLRSTILGMALVRLHRALGYRTVGINHIGDWGAQFGGLVVALRRWRGEVDLANEPVMGLLALYQRSKAAIDEQGPSYDASFAKEARDAYRELESGVDGEVRAQWRWVTQVSLAAFAKTFARLGVTHDLVRGESWFETHLAPTIARVQAAGIAELSQGALVVMLGEVDKGLKETPCLLRQSDGTTLYATRDLAAVFDRWKEFEFERCLYVVGGEQKLHFRQLKAVLKRMHLEWEPRVEHVDFGLLLGPGRVKIASRRGEVLVLDDLLDEVVAAARERVREKNPDLPNLEAIAEQVGIGALVFNDLKRERIKDVIFDKDDLTSFEGETGPYVMYTHARSCSILRKAAAMGAGRPAGPAGVEPDWRAIENASAILLQLGRFPAVVRGAAAKAEPSELAQYLLGLCREYNTWLADRSNKVLGEAPATMAARLALVRGVRIAIGNGLRLLGLAAPEEM